MNEQSRRESLAEVLDLNHFDGNGCGTHGSNGCAVCYGPSPLSAREIVDVLSPLVNDWLAEAERRGRDQVLQTFAPLVTRLDSALERQATSDHKGCACGDAGHSSAIASAKERICEDVRTVLATTPRSECRCPDDCDCDGRFTCEARVTGTTHVCELAVSHDGSHQDQNHRWNQETSA